jgi:ribonuclease P protein component
MVGRIVRSADFQRVLAVAPRSRSAHFAAHHLSASPSLPCKASKTPAATELSTGDARTCPPPVDESASAMPEPAPAGRWLGLVVPKRHARRSVTRSLLKRQMRDG